MLPRRPLLAASNGTVWRVGAPRAARGLAGDALAGVERWKENPGWIAAIATIAKALEGRMESDDANVPYFIQAK